MLKGRLSTITYPTGAARTYLYDDPDSANHRTGIIDENGNRYATWAYDAQGWAILSEHAGGAERSTLTYTPRGWTDLIKVGTDTVYETTDLDYDGVGQLIKATLPIASLTSVTHRATPSTTP